MSQPENEKNTPKDDLRKNKSVDTEAGKTSEGTEGESMENPKKPPVPKSAEKISAEENNDSLENAMVGESVSGSKSDETEQREQEHVNANKDEAAPAEKEEEKFPETKVAKEAPEEKTSEEKQVPQEKPSEEETSEEKLSEDKESSKKNIKEENIEEAESTKKSQKKGKNADEDEVVKEKPSEEKPEEEKLSEEKSSEEKPSEEKLSEEKPEEEKPSEEKPAENQSFSENQETDEAEEEEEGKVSKYAEKKNAQAEFEESVAEDSEDESSTERHKIEKKDYHSMSKEALVEELEKIIKKEKIQAIKEHVEEIRSEFNAKFEEELEEKKEEFLADGGNIIDFHYSTPLKKQFNSLYFDYKEKRNNYYKQLKQDLNKNLQSRLDIIEELKGLLDVEENINTTYKHFKDLQDRWRTAGSIPRDKYNTVWNTYHHHVENFYDFLHLNRDFRDLDFKHNLEQKLKIIDRAEELGQETDTNRAFRELQMLHKMWKEELGPVAKEFREDIWDRFSAATKKIHDLRQAYYDELEKGYEKNLILKQEIIVKIKALADTKYTSHNQWQQKIKELEVLRDAFFKAGKVPRDKNEETWSAFKQNVRQFNRNKNSYYKGLKREQYENLEKKKELIKIAEDNKDNEDFKATTPLMKKIQADWKKIGHVPRRDSDKVWKQFKGACNYYFDRLHSSSREENAEEAKAFDQKKEILDKLKEHEFSGDKRKDLPKIKATIEEWKNIGKVPYNKRFIEGKFNKLLDNLFSKLDVDQKKAEMMKYENKLQAINDADDEKKLRNEHYFLSKKVEETKAEIRQLENNLQFFSNVEDENPLVQEVHKNIRDHKDQLKIWKEKLEKIKSLY